VSVSQPISSQDLTLATLSEVTAGCQEWILAEITPVRSMNRAELDAIELMLRDLNTRHDEIRHRAAFRGCTRELLALQQELVQYLASKREGLNGR